MTIRIISAVKRDGRNDSNMKNKSVNEDDRLDREIDFSNARPNRFWLGVVDRSCVRLIDKDLAELFPDNEMVNTRSKVSVAQRLRGRPARNPGDSHLRHGDLASLSVNCESNHLAVRCCAQSG